MKKIGENIENKKRSCPYPFAQLTTTPTGQYKLCCSSSEAYGPTSEFSGKFKFNALSHSIQDFWTSPYMNWVREKHNKGEPIKECEACYKYESNGSESYRQRAIRELGSYDKAQLQPISLDLKLGNKCNAACLFCDPSSSSRILKEWKELGWDKEAPFETGLTGLVGPELFETDYSWAENPKFWQGLSKISSKITNLKFTGGEPLINPYMMDYLDTIIDSGRSKQVRLQVTTNGIVIPKNFLDILSWFKEVEINFSVDGYGKQNEYIRYPTKWSSWLRNVEKVRSIAGLNIKLYFQHSISVYSVWGLAEYFRWMWPYKEFGFHLFQVFHPEIQQPDVLSRKESELVIGELIELHAELSQKVECDRDFKLLDEISGIISLLSKMEDKSYLKPKLKKYIQRLDKHRGILIKEYLPRAAESLNI